MLQQFPEIVECFVILPRYKLPYHNFRLLSHLETKIWVSIYTHNVVPYRNYWLLVGAVTKYKDDRFTNVRFSYKVNSLNLLFSCLHCNQDMNCETFERISYGCASGNYVLLIGCPNRFSENVVKKQTAANYTP